MKELTYFENIRTPSIITSNMKGRVETLINDNKMCRCFPLLKHTLLGGFTSIYMPSL